MSPLIAGILALLTAAAGWFYLFNSQAAQRLTPLESPASNDRRLRLRRVGGFLMILLAMLLYIGAAVVDWQAPTLWFVITWLAVMLLLVAIVLLALIDLRLTRQLRQKRK